MEIMKQFDKGQIRNFLTKINYKKFNLYPNVTLDNIINYLASDLNEIFKVGKIFITSSNNEITALAALKILKWDTQHYGYTCASIEYIFVNNKVDFNLTKESLKNLLCEIENYANGKQIKFMSANIGACENTISAVLQNHNFKYILTWLDGLFQSKKKLSVSCEDCEVGIIKESELDNFQEMASTSYFKGGRFYRDLNFDDYAVDQMYSKLIMSAYQNDDIMLVYRIKGEPIGLFICKKIIKNRYFDNLKIAPLRYLLVDNNARQKNIGYELFASTLNYLMDDCDIITTGFEVHNLPSLNLHKKFNFQFNYAHNVYHWWAKNATKKSEKNKCNTLILHENMVKK